MRIQSILVLLLVVSGAEFDYCEGVLCPSPNICYQKSCVNRDTLGLSIPNLEVVKCGAAPCAAG